MELRLTLTEDERHACRRAASLLRALAGGLRDIGTAPRSRRVRGLCRPRSIALSQRRVLRRQRRRQGRRRAGRLHPRRHSRRPRQRGSRRGRRFRSARHRAPERRRFPVQFGGGKGGSIVKRGGILLAVFAVIVLRGRSSPLAQRGPDRARRPGYKGDGSTLLPNGWRIAPEGRHVHRRRPADELRAVAGRPLHRDLHQRLGEAGAQHLRHENLAGRFAGANGAHVAGSGVASGREAAVRLRLERQHDLRIHLEGRHAHAEEHDHAGRPGAPPGWRCDRERRLRRRSGGQP